MQQILESIRMAFNSLITNKLRSSLTLLGIAIGLFSIIIVMTAIGAIQNTVEDTFNIIGKDNFFIQKMPAVRIGRHGSWRKYRNRKDITIAEGRRLKRMTKLPVAVGISLSKGGKKIKFEDKTTNPDVYVTGANLDVFKVNDFTIQDGRGFSPQDMELGRNVCIIGQNVKATLFPNIYPVGQIIRFDNLSLKVIGVVKKRGSVLGSNQDNFVIIPLPVYVRAYGKKSSIELSIKAKSTKMLPATMDEVIGALRIIRKVPPGKENDFAMITYDSLIEKFNNLTKYFKLGAGVIAFIALLAAGIGIMNIMLVSVTERTREIGIRKAIGAKKSIIRSQFVTEAIVLSQIGGLIGIILGVIGGNIVALWLGVSVIVPIDWILIGLAVTTFVGVLFGVYPAIKASNLDPIEALRYE